MTPVENWNGRAADRLRALADAVAKAPPPVLVGEERIAFAELETGGATLAERLTRDISHDRGVYIIELDDAADVAAFRATFAAARDARDARPADMKLPQHNPAPPGAPSSRIIYVGNSCATQKRRNTIAARLKQHLVSAPKSTYALNLARWARDVPGDLIVRVYNYPEGTDRDIVVAVEDWLSETSAPICGRRGTQR